MKYLNLTKKQKLYSEAELYQPQKYLDRFINKSKIIFEAPETGEAEINAVYLEIDTNNKKTTKIELLREIVEIN